MDFRYLSKECDETHRQTILKNAIALVASCVPSVLVVVVVVVVVVDVYPLKLMMEMNAQ